MRHRLGVRTAAGAAGVLALAGLAFISFPLLVRLLLALMAAGGLWLWQNGKDQGKEALWRERMIRLLGHHRHDWMNELQVLYGYAKLKRYDNLPDYMDKIKTTALHDSYLSKLGNPALIVYLLEKRIEGGSCSVEVELEQEIDLRKVDMEEEELHALVSGLADRLIACSGSAMDEPGILSIGFDGEEGELLVDFVYQGEADWGKMEEEVRRFLERRRRGFEIREEEFGGDRAIVALAIPFRT